MLERVNPGEALLVKNKHFWASDKIAPTRVKVLNYTGNQQIWNYLIAGRLDSAPFTAVPSGVLNRIRQTDGNEVVKGFSPVAVSMAFNQTKAPYNNVHVRKALAYLIDRSQVTKVASPEGGTPSQTTTGIHAESAKSWLGNGIDSLDQYKLDPAKAAQELKAAGMKQVNGKWAMPDGSPWVVELHVPASFSDWVAAAKAITSQLNDHGIQASVLTSADYTLYLDELAAGKYDIGLWLMALGPSPYNIYQRIYGSANGWQLLAGNLTHVPPGTQGNWMGGPRDPERGRPGHAHQPAQRGRPRPAEADRRHARRGHQPEPAGDPAVRLRQHPVRQQHPLHRLAAERQRRAAPVGRGVDAAGPDQGTGAR